MKDGDRQTALGPVAGRVDVGLKGAILPTSSWRSPGADGPHLLKLDCGRFGHGPMHLSVDGAATLTFAKPSRHKPWVLTRAVEVDGREVVVYAESRNYGDTVACDVFVDGTSLADGRPLSAIAKRCAEAESGSAAYVSPFDAIRNAKLALQQSMWIVPGSIGVRLAVGPHGGSMLPVGVLFGLYCIFVWALALFFGRALKGVTAGDPRRRLKAVVVPAACFAVDLAVGIVLLGLAADGR